MICCFNLSITLLHGTAIQKHVITQPQTWKIKYWNLEMQNKIPAESDNEEKLPKKNEASSFVDKCRKSSLNQ